MIELVPLFAGVVLAQLAPGPNLMAVSATALGSGRRAGLATAAGVAAGVFVWAVLFALGAGALIERFPAALTAMRIAGGSYLLWLGLRALMAIRGARLGAAAPRRTTPRAPARTGLLVVLTDPKAAMMWVAASVYLTGLGTTQAGVALSALTIYGFYALLFSTPTAMRAHSRAFAAIQAGFGAIFGAIGAKLLLDGLREMRA